MEPFLTDISAKDTSCRDRARFSKIVAIFDLAKSFLPMFFQLKGNSQTENFLAK
jgi:hypothetical protein